MGIESYNRFSQLLIDPNVAGDFRTDVMLHRLNELGFKDIFVNDRIKTYGFPCKYNSPLDEAILMLHYFLTKHALFAPSKLMIHAIHFPSKEEETTLAFWKSPKAGLYLDLQSMIILMNGVNRAKTDEKNEIKRLFVFRDNLHLAHLESNGISVILEQQGVGILTGFLIHNNQPQSKLELHRNTLLIEFIHDDAEQCEWALLMDNVHSANYPYGNNMVSKWYKGRLPPKHIIKVASDELDFDEFFKLFAFYEAHPQTKINNRKYYFERIPEKFRTLLVSNFDAALKKRYQGFDWSQVNDGYPAHISAEPPNTGAVEDYKKDYLTSMNVKSVPETLEQFYSALTQIKLSKHVRAIDASSVKSTLKVHETDANYRHWIRASIQLTVKDPEASLGRIYILDLSDDSKDEYEIFKQVITLYQDFTKNRIAKLDDIWPSDEMGFDGNVVMPRCPNSEVKVYLITKQAIEEFCDDDAIEQKAKNGFYRLLREDFVTTECEEYMISDEVKVNLPLLDVLYSDRLVYVYKDLRGEPTQAHYAAKLLLPSEVEKNNHGLQTFLTPEEFRKKQEVYSDLFDRLQELSIQVFSTEAAQVPNTGSDDLPTITEISARLVNKRLEFKKKPTGQKTESDEEEQQTITAVGKQLQSSRSVPGVGISSKQVFFIYAEEDRERVKEVRDKLVAEGYEPFMESDIVPGENKEVVIKAAMKQSKVRLVFFSGISVGQRGPIQSQYKEALNIGREAPEGTIHLIPVKLDDCQLPEEFKSIEDVKVYDPDFWERLQQGLRRAIAPPTELP